MSTTARRVDLTEDDVAAAVGPLNMWAHQCHAASLALVLSDALPGFYWGVARGYCNHILGQHSWIVSGDPFDVHATVIDITAWSYDNTLPRIWVTQNLQTHHPAGEGNIWKSRQPMSGDGPKIEIGGALSAEAVMFLDIVFPGGVDFQGWSMLASGPLGGWPAREIITAMTLTPGLAAAVPIDVASVFNGRRGIAQTI